ncbi:MULTISPECIES: hypothetical protein [unclassified Caballeronia]|uniref:hypothetical protein n=1 Tax=unclassified Caballeronia TaxID=2646786 RepID=UPI00285741AF|nr:MULTISPECIES: hypothetical protein [unclassified Caballeronia]MDR5740755.1 hypothetical protein [Caballeronia sp. LZ016]MDR5808723.1 hypothetical protein [Caballeronia sp. LZ019]
MRSKQSLIELLHGLVQLIDDEASRNSEFAAKLDALVQPVYDRPEGRARAGGKRKDADVPDVHQELASRGEDAFRTWLREQSVEVLRAIIRREDLDASRRASKWKDVTKLANFIADGLKARMSRGAAFMARKD